VIFQDFPGPGIFKKKIQDFPGGVGTLVIPLLSATHGQCDARPTVTFPDCAGIKFTLLGDSWLPRILIL